MRQPSVVASRRHRLDRRRGAFRRIPTASLATRPTPTSASRAGGASMTQRIGADVGGTFTDVIAEDETGRISFRKVLSTPPSYDEAVVNAVRHLVLDGASSSSAQSVAEVVHGTTVATNAVLER